MTIVIPKTQAASPEAIAQLRERYGDLPADYLEFLNYHDGATPPETVLAGTNNNVGVRCFIPAARIPMKADQIAGLTRSVIPIAEDEGGNFVCLGAKDHRIYYWDHETNPFEEIDALELLRSSFQEFVDDLVPFLFDDEPVGRLMSHDPNFKPKL